jgi:FkbM family methyltransferase
MKKLLQQLLNAMGVEIRLLKSLHHQLREAYPEQKKILSGVPVKVIFDVGAYDGTTSMKYHSYFPEAKCYAFEPFPSSYNMLEKNAKLHKYITPVNTAVGDSSGSATFYINNEPMTNSLFAPAKTNTFVDDLTHNKGKVEVNVITLDEFAAGKNIGAIDLLKIDVQGNELNVLKGAEQLLNNTRIKLIYCEVEFEALYENQPLFHEVCTFLYSKGYYLFGLYNLVHFKNGQISWGDAIFLPSGFQTPLLMNREKWH